jgi:hypothetical protein
MGRPLKRKQLKRADLSVDSLLWLLTGKFCFEFGNARRCGNRVWHRAREIWEFWREDILTAWAQVLPGSRPCAWWEFSMPEGTRREAVIGVHYYNYHPGGCERYSYGLPTCHDAREPAVQYESEFDYLERLGLLFDCEADVGEYVCNENSCNTWHRDEDESIGEVVRLLGFERNINVI